MKNSLSIYLSFYLSILFATNLVFAKDPIPVRPEGAGTITNRYLISELGNLAWMANGNGSNAYFAMTANIDASETKDWYDGAGFKPISFVNSDFEGRGFAIYNLYINRPEEDYVGLFSITKIISNGTDYRKSAGDLDRAVSSVNLINCQITGKNYVGGVTGNACGFSYTLTAPSPGTSNTTKYGTYHIYNCFVSGYLNGEASVGGVIGYNGISISTSTTSYSYHDFPPCRDNYFIGEVCGTVGIGGIVGSGG